jgi:drug/metabolite transporter (DMT)-like permease
MPTEREYWFPAKRYGWGWGIPTTWQGWLVLAAFAVLLIIGSIVFPPGKQIWSYLAYVAVLCVLLSGICWLKGEPPRWRWGKD